MRHPNRWNYPVHIPPARRVTSGVRQVHGDPPVLLERPVLRRDTLQHQHWSDAACVLILLVGLALLWRALIER